MSRIRLKSKAKKAWKTIGVVLYFVLMIAAFIGYGFYYGWGALLENAWTWVIMFSLVIPIALWFSGFFGIKK